jgi:S1-C subfamily serine protease
LLILLLILIGASGVLWYQNFRLQQHLAEANRRVEGLADLLERAEQNSFSRDDFEAARSEWEGILSDTALRVRSLEALAGAPERIIASAARAVVFIQASYGFREPGTNLPLRYYPGAGGRPLRMPNGETPVTTSGDGPIVQVFYTGTAFVVSREGHLVSNRHIALPWLYNESARGVLEQGFTPEMRRFIGYIPGHPQPFGIEILAASDHADVAILRSGFLVQGVLAGEIAHPFDRPDAEADEANLEQLEVPVATTEPEASSSPAPGAPAATRAPDAAARADWIAPIEERLPFAVTPLEISQEPPALGDQVILLGYPAGMEALLARADPRFAEGLLSTGPVTFWDVARGLAAGGYIAPLATMGIIGQVTGVSVVYDAETTHGGSGGPVLALDGRVVAVNSAVVEYFSGHNLGVPAADVFDLLRSVRAAAPARQDSNNEPPSSSGR